MIKKSLGRRKMSHSGENIMLLYSLLLHHIWQADFISYDKVLIYRSAAMSPYQDPTAALHHPVRVGIAETAPEDYRRQAAEDSCPVAADSHRAEVDNFRDVAGSRPVPGDTRPDVEDMHPAAADIHQAVEDMHPAAVDTHQAVEDMHPAAVDTHQAVEGMRHTAERAVPMAHSF
jgi:hypothetical protein